MTTVPELKTVVERHVDLPGMRAEIRTYDWDIDDSVRSTPDAFYFTLTLQKLSRDQPLYWKLPGSKRFMSVGTCGVSPPGAAIEIKRTRNVVRTFILRVEPELFRRITGLDDGWYDERLMNRVNKEGVSTVRLLNSMATELTTPGYATETLLEALATSFLVQFSRMVREGRTTATGYGLSEWQMNRIREMIDTLPANRLTIAALASACGISGRHLMRGFKAVMGTTVHGYIEHVRIERTKQLLGSTRLSLEVIAAQVGFCSGSHMSTAFLKAQGMPPSLFRQRFSQPIPQAVECA